MTKTIITDKVNKTFFNSVSNLGTPDLAPELAVAVPLGYGDELEFMVNVNREEFFTGDALATLTAFEDDVIMMSFMFFGNCSDAKLSNEAAEKFFLEGGCELDWGFYEEFYPGDAMRICTSFKYTDEEDLCREIESRMAIWGDRGFTAKLSPITKYFPVR